MNSRGSGDTRISQSGGMSGSGWVETLSTNGQSEDIHANLVELKMGGYFGATQIQVRELKNGPVGASKAEARTRRASW